MDKDGDFYEKIINNFCKIEDYEEKNKEIANHHNDRFYTISVVWQ